MRDTRTPREDEPRHRRGGDKSRQETWYEECARHPVDEPLIATIPLPDDK
jgi:hypothetical protein